MFIKFLRGMSAGFKNSGVQKSELREGRLLKVKLAKYGIDLIEICETSKLDFDVVKEMLLTDERYLESFCQKFGKKRDGDNPSSSIFGGADHCKISVLARSNDAQATPTTRQPFRISGFAGVSQAPGKLETRSNSNAGFSSQPNNFRKLDSTDNGSGLDAPFVQENKVRIDQSSTAVAQKLKLNDPFKLPQSPFLKNFESEKSMPSSSKLQIPMPVELVPSTSKTAREAPQECTMSKLVLDQNSADVSIPGLQSAFSPYMQKKAQSLSVEEMMVANEIESWNRNHESIEGDVIEKSDPVEEIANTGLSAYDITIAEDGWARKLETPLQIVEDEELRVDPAELEAVLQRIGKNLKLIEEINQEEICEGGMTYNQILAEDEKMLRFLDPLDDLIRIAEEAKATIEGKEKCVNCETLKDDNDDAYEHIYIKGVGSSRWLDSEANDEIEFDSLGFDVDELFGQNQGTFCVGSDLEPKFGKETDNSTVGSLEDEKLEANEIIELTELLSEDNAPRIDQPLKSDIMDPVVASNIDVKVKSEAPTSKLQRAPKIVDIKPFSAVKMQLGVESRSTMSVTNEAKSSSRPSAPVRSKIHDNSSKSNSQVSENNSSWLSLPKRLFPFSKN